MSSPLEIGLYGILDADRVEGNLAEVAKIAAHAGVQILQYRDKNGSGREMIEKARAIKQALVGTNVPLLMNDRVDITLAANLDGVHLGQTDMMVGDARRILGNSAIIGQTINNEKNLREAPIPCLDYVCIGGIFETQSKNNKNPPLGLEGLEQLIDFLRNRMNSDLPAGAIAGITRDNASDVIEAGADGIALISDLFRTSNPSQATQDLRQLVDDTLKKRKNKETIS